MFGKKKSTTRKNCRVVTELLDPQAGTGDAVQSWRVFRIMSEFVTGFEKLREYGLAATIFGSARTKPGEKYYEECTKLAAQLSKKGFTIITGGGGGIMEAANVGAFNADGQSLGLNIKLPFEQKLNEYTTDAVNFDFFFSRKVMLAFAAEVYIYFPGGFGTMDEFFEIITLIQTKKIERIPVVLYGKHYWEPLLRYCKDTLLEEYETISPEDLDLFVIVDSVEEAMKYILKNVDTKNPRQL